MLYVQSWCDRIKWPVVIIWTFRTCKLWQYILLNCSSKPQLTNSDRSQPLRWGRSLFRNPTNPFTRIFRHPCWRSTSSRTGNGYWRFSAFKELFQRQQVTEPTSARDRYYKTFLAQNNVFLNVCLKGLRAQAITSLVNDHQLGTAVDYDSESVVAKSTLSAKPR